MTIGIIGEGVTDQISVESILIGYSNDKGLPVTYLQPKSEEPGGWYQVFEYCKSDDFKQAFSFNDYIVIQIDTDFLRGDSVPAGYRIAGIEEMSPPEIVVAVKEKLVECIGQDFYDAYSQKIIFAIAVDAIECWFLAIYFPSDKKKAAKHKNCLETLNKELPKKEGFYINEKKEVYYRKISKHFRKNKDLMKYSRDNDSFRMFIEELLLKLQQ